MKSRLFLCVRPTLASRLFTEGFTGRSCKNPYSPKRWAWEFDWTPQLQRCVDAYYREIKEKEQHIDIKDEMRNSVLYEV